MIMTSLKSRIIKLEKSIPIKKSLAELTIEELNDKIFIFYQSMSDKCKEADTDILLTTPKCRQFYKKGMPWVMNRNHRLSVFLKFKQIMLKLEMPNEERIESIFNLGWRGVEIHADDIDWLLTELIDIDMGEEKPWLKSYLEYSGK